MTSNNKIDISLPTPFGWIVTAQPAFDLSAIVAFRNQLVALQESLGAKPIVTAADGVAEASGDVLTPVRVNPRQ